MHHRAPAPGAPAGLTATAGNARVTLSWAAPASDGAAPVVSYRIYIATAPGVRESTAIGTTTGTGGVVTGLVNGTTYYFMVTAVHAAGDKIPSSWVSAEPVAPTRGEAVSPTLPTARKQLIAYLAAAAAVAAAGALTLIARRRQRLRSPDLARSAPGLAPAGQQMDAASDERAVPDTTWPG